jgi:hypothetical protein
MTQVNLEAYEAMEARPSGAVVKPSNTPVLVSQSEVQHAQMTASAVVTVTWMALYDL